MENSKLNVSDLRLILLDHITYCSKLINVNKIFIDCSVNFVSMLLVSTAAFLYLQKYHSQKFVDCGKSQVWNFVSSAGHNPIVCCFIKQCFPDDRLISKRGNNWWKGGGVQVVWQVWGSFTVYTVRSNLQKHQIEIHPTAIPGSKLPSNW